MGLPAARVLDMHMCPMFDGPKPHVGGPISGVGSSTVLIGGMPAATVGDMCTCTGPPDLIIKGSNTVLVGNKPLARLGDSTAHGGTIVLGCPTVLIGGGSGSGSGGTYTYLGKSQFNKSTANELSKSNNEKSLTDSAIENKAFAKRDKKDDYTAQFNLSNARNKPLPNVPYEIRMNDNTVHKGKTDADGKTQLIPGYATGDGIISFNNTNS